MNEVLTITNHDANLLALFMVLGIIGTLVIMSLSLTKFTELVYSVIKALATKTRSYGMNDVVKLIVCILSMLVVSAFMYKGINFEDEVLQLSFVESLKWGLVLTLVSAITAWLVKYMSSSNNRAVVENKEDKDYWKDAKDKHNENKEAFDKLETNVKESVVATDKDVSEEEPKE